MLLNSAQQEKAARDVASGLLGNVVLLSEKNYVYKSFGLFPLHWRSRRWSIRLCENVFAQFFILLLIVINAIILALYDPLQPQSAYNAVMEHTEILFLLLFTLEALVKLYAFGAYFEENGRNKTCYFKSHSNRLDFALLCFGYIQLSLSNFGSGTPFTSAIRLVRLIRPLQYIKSVPAFSWVTQGVFRSLPQLVSALLLVFIVDTIFAVAGIFYFHGTLLRLGEDGTWANPNFNATSFDDAAHAWVILFELTTLEGWSEVMDQISNALGRWSQVYFIALVVGNGWILVNFLIALLAMNISVQRKLYQAEKDMEGDARAIKQRMEERERYFSTNTQLSDQSDYVKFLKTHGITLVQSMDMRLMLSYERMRDVPGYEVVSEQEYARLSAKHAPALYAKWKDAIRPLLDPLERIACLRRMEDEEISPKQVVDEERGSARASQALGMDTVTPRFVMEELAEIKAKEEAMSADAAPTAAAAAATTTGAATPDKHKHPFRRFDDWLHKRVKRVRRWRKFVQANLANKLEGRVSLAQRACYEFANWIWFEKYFMTLVILFNVVALAMVHYDQPEWMFDFSRISNLVLFVIFLLEMVIKLVGFGPTYYLTNAWCLFDGIITLLSALQFAESNSSISEFGVAISAFRTFRLIRLLPPVLVSRVALQRIFQAFLRTLKVVFPLGFFMLIFLLMFSILGLHLFGGEGRMAPNSRANFDTMRNAMLTSFMLMMGDGWNSIMYDAVGGTQSLWTFFYFFFAILLGNFLVLNIFLGVLIDSFLMLQQQDRIGARVVASAEEQVSPARKRKSFRRRQSRNINAEADPSQAILALKEHLLEQSTLKEARKHAYNFAAHESVAYKSLYCLDANAFPRKHIGQIVISRAFNIAMLLVISASCIAICFPTTPAALNIFFCILFACEALAKIIAFGFAMHPGAYLKDRYNAFDFALCIVLIAGEITIAVTATGEESTAGRICTAFRAFYALRIVRYAAGLRTAMQNLYDALLAVLELLLVIVCFFIAFAIFTTLIYGGKFYACYDLANNVTRLEDAELCHINSKYVDASSSNWEWCTPNNTCLNWRNPSYGGGGSSDAVYSFDSFGQSLLMLLEISTVEEWTMPMFSAMDIVGIGHNAVREASFYHSIFFCLAVLVLNVLLIQVFVAVVVDSFRQNERELEAKAYLTPRQAEWVKMRKRALQLPFHAKRIPDKRTRRVHAFVTSRAFKRARVLVIILNSALLLSMHYPASPQYIEWFRIGDYFFGSLYMCGLALKCIAFGLREVMKRWLNWLDIIICFTTLLSWALAFSVPQFFIAAQVIDSLQVLHIVYYFPRTSDLLFTMSLSAPALGNVMALMFLVLYLYSIVGVAVFSGELVAATESTSSLLNEYVNFDTFDKAIVTLVRISTGEGWNGIMHEMASQASAFAYFFCVSFVILVQFLLLNLIIAVLMCDLEEEMESEAMQKSSKVSRRHAHEYAQVWADVRYDYDARRQLKQERAEKEQEEETEVAVAVVDTTAAAGGKEEEEEARRASSVFSPVQELFQGIMLANEGKHEEMSLPASELPALLTRLRPPLGLKGVRFVTRSDILRVIGELRIPVSPSGDIHFHSTLYGLLDKVILQDAINRALDYSANLATKGALAARTMTTPKSRQQPQHQLEGIFQELEDLLHLQVPKHTVQYEQRIMNQMQREDGFHAANIIAAKLLHKAASRYLKNKRILAASSSELSATSRLSKRRKTITPRHKSVASKTEEEEECTPTTAAVVAASEPEQHTTPCNN